MEHSYIEDHLVVDRYLLNQLSAAERGLFEQHYLSCPHCLDELELSEKIIRGVKRTSADQVAKILSATEDTWSLGRSRRWHSTAIWAMAALFLFALPSGLVYRGLDRLEDRLQAAHSELRQVASSPQQSGEGVRAEIEEMRRELADYRRQADQKLEDERQKLAAIEAEAAVALRPQANTLILPLSRLRSTPDGEPSYRLMLPEQPEWWVLELPLSGLEFERYSTLLRTDQGREVWRGDLLYPDRSGALSIGIHSSWLGVGIYTMELEGLTQDEKRVAAGSFAFEVQSGELR